MTSIKSTKRALITSTLAILMCAAGILAVVDMEDSNLFFSEDTVKRIHDSIEMMDDIISAVTGVTGIKADPQFVVMHYTIVNGSQFFKCTTNFRAFSGHGLQCNAAVCVRREDFVQPFNNLCGSGLNSFAYMGTGMKDQGVAFTGNGTFKLFGEKFNSKGESFWSDSVSEIDDVGSVDNNLPDAMGFHVFPGRINLKFADVFSAGILRSTGIEHKCISSIGDRFFRRTKEHLFSTHAYVRT